MECKCFLARPMGIPSTILPESQKDYTMGLPRCFHGTLMVRA